MMEPSVMRVEVSVDKIPDSNLYSFRVDLLVGNTFKILKRSKPIYFSPVEARNAGERYFASKMKEMFAD